MTGKGQIVYSKDQQEQKFKEYGQKLIKQEYDGMFKDSHFHGEGFLQYKEDVYYTGQFLKSKRHGEGFINYNNIQLQYQGNWRNDKAEGKGKLTNTK